MVEISCESPAFSHIEKYFWLNSLSTQTKRSQQLKYLPKILEELPKDHFKNGIDFLAKHWSGDFIKKQNDSYISSSSISAFFQIMLVNRRCQDLAPCILRLFFYYCLLVMEMKCRRIFMRKSSVKSSWRKKLPSTVWWRSLLVA